MSRALIARVILAAVGVAVWGYGYRTNDANVRLAAICILAISLLLRFVPGRWLGDDRTP